jgi:hypothetical protein
MPLQVAYDLNNLDWQRLLVVVPDLLITQLLRIHCHTFPINKDQ